MLTWNGLRSSALALFLTATIAAGVSVLGQGNGGGLSASTVNRLVLSPEILLILAALATPLLVLERVDKRAMIAVYCCPWSAPAPGRLRAPLCR